MKRLMPLALLIGGFAIAAAAPWRSAPVSGSAPVQAVTKVAIFEDPVAPKVSPKGYDLTIVEFQDYNCPVCRRAHPVVAALLASDRKIRLIYRDWPIFGPVSDQAARAAIASQWQGRHEAFNAELFRGAGRLDVSAIRAAADRAGVDWVRLRGDLVRHRREIAALMARTDRQARTMGLQGTPAFVIGPYLVPGALDLNSMRKIVAEARTRPDRPVKGP